MNWLEFKPYKKDDSLADKVHKNSNNILHTVVNLIGDNRAYGDKTLYQIINELEQNTATTKIATKLSNGSNSGVDGLIKQIATFINFESLIGEDFAIVNTDNSHIFTNAELRTNLALIPNGKSIVVNFLDKETKNTFYVILKDENNNGIFTGDAFYGVSVDEIKIDKNNLFIEIKGADDILKSEYTIVEVRTIDEVNNQQQPQKSWKLVDLTTRVFTIDDLGKPARVTNVLELFFVTSILPNGKAKITSFCPLFIDINDTNWNIKIIDTSIQPIKLNRASYSINNNAGLISVQVQGALNIAGLEIYE